MPNSPDPKSSSPSHAHFPTATSAITWCGAVMQLAGYLHDGKPMRLAVWSDGSHQLLRIAVVEGHGGVVLRELLAQLRAELPREKLPTRLKIRPTDAACFHDEKDAVVEHVHDATLNMLISMEELHGRIPYSLPIYRGVGPTKSRAKTTAAPAAQGCP